MTEKSTRTLHALVCGGIAALTVAAVDATTGFIAADSRFLSPFMSLAAYAATVALTLVVYFVVRLAAGPLLAVRGARDGEALSTAVAAGVTCTLVALDTSALRADVGGAFGLAVDVALGVIATAGVYALAIAARGGARRHAAAALGRALPVVAPFLAVAAWVLFVRVGDVTSLLFVVGLLAALAAALGLARLASRPAVRTWQALTGAITVVALLCGALSVAAIRHGEAIGVTHNTIKRGTVKRVVLLSVDTLRRDALSCYGSTTVKTPHIDRFARDGCRFQNAYASSPWTLPSFASILSGLPSRVHGAVVSTIALPDTVKTLAESFRAAGYLTHAYVTNGMLAPHRGVAQGFQHYELTTQPLNPVSLGEMMVARVKPRIIAEETATNDVTEAAIRFVRAHPNDGYFLWVHYLDPHLPYTPEPANVTRMNVHDELGYRLDIESATRPSLDLFGDASRRVWARSLYDGEVRNVDAHIGRFLDAMKETGVYDDALIVFAVDHGEEFWDHDSFEHGHTLYNELVQVPLIVKAPGVAARVVEDAVAIYDIAPTVLELCGLPGAPGPGGVSLVPTLQTGAPVAARPIYTGATLFRSNYEGVVFAGWKYIRSATTGREELYDLHDDPLERRSRVDDSPDMLRRGRQLLEGNLRDAEQYRRLHGIENRILKLDPEEIERLRALGYL